MTFINKKLARSIISTSILATLGLASYNAAARIDTLPVSFETRSEANLQLIQAVDFGNIMGLAAFSDCTLPLGALGTIDWSATPFTTTPAAASTIVATGTGCTSNGKSKLGHYVIVGDASTVVKIKLTTTTGGTDFNFAPVGSADVNAGANHAGTPDIALPTDTLTDVTLDGTGKAAMLVGGTVTIGGTALTAGTVYTMNYDVEVTF